MIFFLLWNMNLWLLWKDKNKAPVVLWGGQKVLMSEWFGWAVSASTYHVWFSITRWHLALNPSHTFPAFSTGWNYEWENLKDLNAGETLPAAPAHQQRFRSSNNTPSMCDRSTETTNTSLKTQTILYLISNFSLMWMNVIFLWKSFEC